MFGVYSISNFFLKLTLYILILRVILIKIAVYTISPYFVHNLGERLSIIGK
jgi:hypothetical protein